MIEQMTPKRAKMEPKWRPKSAKNAPKTPKGSQRGAKWPKNPEKRHAKNEAGKSMKMDAKRSWDGWHGGMRVAAFRL